jgi:hypothetical protein
MRDDYQITLDTIIKKNTDGLTDPASVLESLLQGYVKKKLLPGSIFITNTGPPELALARKFLGLLDPVKYSGFLKPRVRSKNTVNPFKERLPENNLRYFILHLNLYSKKRKLPDELHCLFGAFFSFYEGYRPLLSENLLESFRYTDLWNHHVSTRLASIFSRLGEADEIVVMEYLEKLCQYQEWMPQEQRQFLTDILYRLLAGYNPNFGNQDLNYRKLLYKAVTSLKNWILPEKRGVLLQVILLDLRNNTFCLSACSAIVSLSEWVSSDNISGRIQYLLASMQGHDLMQIEQSCEALQRLLPVIPHQFARELAQCSLNACRRNSLGLKAKVLALWGAMSEWMPEAVNDEVADIVLTEVSNENHHVSSAACAAFARLRKLKECTVYIPVLDKMHVMMNKRELEGFLRAECIKTLSQTMPQLYSQMLPRFMADLMQILKDQSETEIVKLSALAALKSLHAHCDSRMGIEFVNQLMLMIKSNSLDVLVRIKSVCALDAFQSCYYAAEMRSQIVTDLFNEVVLNNEAGLLDEICGYLRKVRHFIPRTALNEMLEQTFTDLNDQTALIRIRSCQKLQVLSRLLDDRMRDRAIFLLTGKLESSNAHVRIEVCKALHTFRSFMSQEQKMHLLCRLRLFPDDQHANMLMLAIYSQYRVDVSAGLLLMLPQGGSRSLSSDEADTIMRMSC